MTGLLRKATLFAVCGLLAASAAFASVPSPTNTENKPACISLVGDDGAGTTDPIGEFCITVRDLANLAINNSLVVVDFSACSGLTICDNNEFGATVDCATYTVRAFTDVNGLVCFRIKGHANNSGKTLPINAYDCGRLYADGVLLNTFSVSAYDQNGTGMGPADLASWLGDFFGGSDPSRSDYDCSESVSGPPGVGPADLALWLTAFFAGGSSSNCPGAKADCLPQIP